jgi:MerR family transcriptional regulator, copper efflux regulator
MLINEIAKMAELSKDGVRHYEELGLITSTPRQAGSRTYRDYDSSVLKTIEDIRGLQRLGLSLHEIEPILKVVAAGPTKKQTIEFVEDRLRVVRGKIAELSEIEEYMAQKLKRLKEESAPKRSRGTGKKNTSTA